MVSVLLGVDHHVLNRTPDYIPRLGTAVMLSLHRGWPQPEMQGNLNVHIYILIVRRNVGFANACNGRKVNLACKSVRKCRRNKKFDPLRRCRDGEKWRCTCEVREQRCDFSTRKPLCPMMIKENRLHFCFFLPPLSSLFSTGFDPFHFFSAPAVDFFLPVDNLTAAGLTLFSRKILVVCRFSNHEVYCLCFPCLCYYRFGICCTFAPLKTWSRPSSRTRSWPSGWSQPDRDG